MRSYGSVKPGFWTGTTGKFLRGDAEAQVVALYLMTSPHASMLGVYYLPVAYVGHETGMALDRAQAALKRVCATGFAEYDQETEYVWVPTLAYHQVAPRLQPNDKRVTGIRSELRRLGAHPFAASFRSKYGDAFCLKPDRDVSSTGSSGGKLEEEEGRGSEGASKPPCPVPVPVLASDPDPEAVCAEGERPTPEHVLAAYEEARAGTDWSQCRKLTEGRTAAARALLSEFGLATIREALRRARQCAFLTDPDVRNANPTHATWRPTIEWILEPDTITKILEGAYDDRNASTGHAPPADGEDRRVEAAAALGCQPDELRYDASTGEYELPSGGAA